MAAVLKVDFSSDATFAAVDFVYYKAQTLAALRATAVCHTRSLSRLHIHISCRGLRNEHAALTTACDSHELLLSRLL